MIISQAWVKLLPLFPLGVQYVRGQEQPNGIWKWNKKKIRWHNAGKCPHCGTYQTWKLVMDDSYVVSMGYFRCKVSCKNPECAKQVSLIIQNGEARVEEGKMVCAIGIR